MVGMIRGGICDIHKLGLIIKGMLIFNINAMGLLSISVVILQELKPVTTTLFITFITRPSRVQLTERKQNLQRWLILLMSQKALLKSQQRVCSSSCRAAECSVEPPCLMCPAHHTSLELLWSNLINPTFKLKVLYYKIRSVAFTAFTLSV